MKGQLRGCITQTAIQLLLAQKSGDAIESLAELTKVIRQELTDTGLRHDRNANTFTRQLC